MMNNYDAYYNYQDSMNTFNNVSGITQLNDNDLVDPYTALVRGNLFKKLYNQYKNFKPSELTPTNEQEQMLLLVQMYCFSAHELTLYLDNYPNDLTAIKLRDDYNNAYKKALNQYELKYGPLLLSSNTLNNVPWAWDTKKWPWEGFTNVEI